MQNNGIFKWLGLPALTLLLASPALGLQSDRNQPINVQSDSFSRDAQKGIAVYEGSVVVTQGTLQIHADKVEIYTSENEANRIICTGQPARFQQQTNPEEGLITGRANTINYNRSTEDVRLEEQANFTRADGTTLDSDSILYNLITQEMTAAGKGGGRVEMVLPPKTEAKESVNGDS